MVAIALSLLLAFADDRTSVADYLGDAAAQLAANNPRGFLKRFNPEMPGYAQLETEVTALLKVAEVSSAAQVLEMTATDEGVALQVDWFIQLRLHGEDLAGERRRELVQVRLKRVGKGWRIQSLTPLSLFVAPHL
ncbi:MAG: hypothetical protein K2X03_18890 [Bryobacteraceae bacterium]|nr:hypothetical protein [Bryobacteraceae bacterium]